METRAPLFLSWCTAYFDHGDLSKHDLDAIQYIVPSVLTTPSIYSMTPEEIEETAEVLPLDAFDSIYVHLHADQRRGMYRRMLFDRAYRDAYYPLVKITAVTAGRPHSFELAARFSMEEDEKAHGGNNVDYWKWMHKANHMVRSIWYHSVFSL